MCRIWIAAGALFALAATPAFAQNPSGLYVGVGLGDFSTQVNDTDDLDDIDFDSIDFDADEDATKVFAGWRFNRLVSAQVDYIDFGRSRAASNLLDIDTQTKGLAPSVLGTLPLGPVELFARAGIIFYDVEVSSGNNSLVDESGEDIVYGAGVGVVLGRVNIRGEVEVIEISELEDAEAVWISAAWRF